MGKSLREVKLYTNRLDSEFSIDASYLVMVARRMSKWSSLWLLRVHYGRDNTEHAGCGRSKRRRISWILLAERLSDLSEQSRDYKFAESHWHLSVPSLKSGGTFHGKSVLVVKATNR